jgi:hypothetical protein
MRKLRTSREVRLIVTLSFSAHSTGSLALLTSTARVWAMVDVAPDNVKIASIAAASDARTPLPVKARAAVRT